jgi:acetyltransferase-like isoleucine patch superfamily enzyme
VNSKRVTTALLSPVARIVHKAEPLRRAWAHARLSGAIDGPLHSSVVVLGVPEIHGTGQIYLGKNLYLYRDLYLETQGQGKITIGDDVVISRGVHIVSFAGVQIGAGSMIGEYASVRDSNHHYGAGCKLRESGHLSASIEIGGNVWIGRGVAVLAGVRIGDNAVVGANAVVTRDVADHAVVAGVPAKPIQRGVSSR